MADPKSDQQSAGLVPQTNADAAVPPKPLTEEEQMALYEESLKEADWGHQPC